MKFPTRAACALAFGFAVVPATVDAQTEPRVLLVGDSWAAQQWGDGSHRLVFDANGATSAGVVGATTTESGSTAAQWAQPARLATIQQVLDAAPGIDTVQVTIGGNDFLDAWSTQMTPAQVEALKEQIRLDLETVVGFILAYRPDMMVVISLYDYPNFVDTLGGIVGPLFCRPLHDSLGQPTPRQINEALIEFETAYAELAAHPRVRYVRHAGLMQYTYGFPGAGIPPGSLAPPGDLDRPSPLESMRNLLIGRDCFHLRPAGYDVLVQNLYDNFYAARFDTLLFAPFE